MWLANNDERYILTSPMHSRHNQSRVDCTQMYQTRPSVFEGFVLGLEGNEVGRFTQPVRRQMVFSMEAVRFESSEECSFTNL